jgi:hypothetical protein
MCGDSSRVTKSGEKASGVTIRSNACNRLQKLSVLTILSGTLVWSDRGKGPCEHARRTSKMTSVEEMENEG